MRWFLWLVPAAIGLAATGCGIWLMVDEWRSVRRFRRELREMTQEDHG